MSSPIRVFLSDDHPFIRRGLRETLDAADNIHVIGEAADGPSALGAIRRLAQTGEPPDVLVTDLSMPGFDGLELLARVQTEVSGLAVILLSVHPESEIALAALKAGASGYVEKRSAPDQIVEAVQLAFDGRTYIGRALGQQLAEAALSPTPGPEPQLSPRELQVVRGIADGLSRNEIADSLAVSPATVTTFKRRAASKIGVATDVGIARYAFARGIAEAPHAGLDEGL